MLIEFCMIPLTGKKTLQPDRKSLLGYFTIRYGPFLMWPHA